MSSQLHISHYGRVGLLTSPHEWELEKRFNETEVFGWFKDNWTMGFPICAFYVVVIFGGQLYMEKRSRFNLRRPLLFWSLFLALFSILGSIRTLISFLKLYEKGGSRGLVCDNHFYTSPISRFWGLAFVLSKAPELVDTVFIVLRKQKLIFLHWYHHVTVLLFSWYCYEGQRSGGAIFMTMNFIVHAMMYTYYTFRAAGYKVPRPIAMVVTTMQIIQMVVGCVTFYHIYLWRNDADCFSPTSHVVSGAVMYGSYLILFCHFFYVAYFMRRSIAQESVKTTQIAEPQTNFKNSEKLEKDKANLSPYNLRQRKLKKAPL